PGDPGRVGGHRFYDSRRKDLPDSQPDAGRSGAGDADDGHGARAPRGEGGDLARGRPGEGQRQGGLCPERGAPPDFRGGDVMMEEYSIPRWQTPIELTLVDGARRTVDVFLMERVGESARPERVSERFDGMEEFVPILDPSTGQVGLVGRAG